MIHPSYSELIQAINANSEDDDNTMLLNSRYSLVLATSKRARQIIGGAKPLVSNADGKKALSIAIDELYRGKVKILAKEAAESAGIPIAQVPVPGKASGADKMTQPDFDLSDAFLDETEDPFDDEFEEEDLAEDGFEEDFADEDYADPEFEDDLDEDEEPLTDPDEEENKD